MKPWALWLDAEGGAHVRPLFEGEMRGHGYTGPLKTGETEIEAADGAYPDKWELSTPAYRTKRTAELSTVQSPFATMADLKATEEWIKQVMGI